MKIIIVPVDFSPAALNAAHYAADMALAIDAGLALLHVCSTPVAISEIPVPIENMDEVIHTAEQELLELKKELQAKAGRLLSVHTEVRVGNTLLQLKDYCQTVQPFAVVMGPNDKETIERLLFGSNTLQAVSSLSWPLLVVPPGAVFTAIRKVGLACDFRQVNESVPVKAIKELVQQFGAQLHVVHVSDGPGGLGIHLPKDELEHLKEMLGQLNPTYHFMSRGDIDEGINEFAGKCKLDLLIVIPRKHTLLGGLFHKSHTKHLLLHAHTPVLSIHE